MRNTVLMLIAFLVFPVHAWEKDVHYGLTAWLALQAGYSGDDARVLAEAADYADVVFERNV